MATTKAPPLELMLELPALMAPPGVKYDFVNPSNLQTNFYIDLVLCLTISSLAVSIRIWTKARLIKKFGREDWVCLLAFIIFATYCGHIFYTLQLVRVGVHQWNVQLKSLSTQLYHTRIAAANYCFVIATIKLSILLEFLRIFSPGRRNVTFWIYHILIWLNLLFYIIICFLQIFPCEPLERFWKPWIDGRCLQAQTINIVTASFNSASNLSLLIVPQRVIWNLQMSIKRKFGVSAIFLAGVFACFSSLIRLYYSIRLSKSEDITYHIGLLGLWSLPEMASGFLAICLPVSPRFCQSLKQVEIPSFLSISRPCLGRFSKSDGYLTRLNSPSGLPKRSILLPGEKASSRPPKRRSASLVSSQPAPVDDSFSYTKLEPGNSQILRCIEISTTNEPIDANTTISPIHW